ncbi:hypothetical protein QNO07_25030 [Streptomyces sp. 549]|uniref:hypothetical protein n=1 Tax=Streptomyces sp. 549 TaxID=3049076 RepID=UPI0024C31BDE|nr:hypothetical protein [Streptomyces sp. 549]MDK1476628.1 hypothetical protein [Streptomyces sp. 549]
MLVAAVCVLLLAACGSSDNGSAAPDMADQDRFLREYVQSLNASDEKRLARLLDSHPQGAQDARARVDAYGGQAWDVLWSRTSEFTGVWRIELTGTARAEDRPVEVTETVAWEDERWVMAPLPGVAPIPGNVAGTTPPD